jgi:hypothetical protein
MWARAAVLALLVLIGPAAAQSPSPVPYPPAVPYPKEYKTTLLKYALVDRADGLSRDLYVSRDAFEAVQRDPGLSELPVGALFALDVYSARMIRRDPRTGASVFEKSPDGHLVRSKDEHTLHLMQKTRAGFGSRTWAFGGFDPATALPLKLDLPGDCLLCHQAALVSDLSFSLTLLRRYVATGQVQYGFCAQPGRQICPF